MRAIHCNPNSGGAAATAASLKPICASVSKPRRITKPTMKNRLIPSPPSNERDPHRDQDDREASAQRQSLAEYDAAADRYREGVDAPDEHRKRERHDRRDSDPYPDVLQHCGPAIQDPRTGGDGSGGLERQVTDRDAEQVQAPE